MTAQIIEARHRFLSAALPPIPEPIEPGAPQSFHSKSLLNLPFVTLASVPVVDWEDFWKRSVLWNDQPTGDGVADFRRGRDYAHKALAAIIDDNSTSRSLEMVVDAILQSGFQRRGPGGRLCRQLSVSESAFVMELVSMLVTLAKMHRVVPLKR